MSDGRTVTIRFTSVAVTGHPGETDGWPIIFSFWLPRGPQERITFTHDSCSGLLWFELKSAPWINDEASIERTVNVQVESLLVDITTGVDGELARWMQARDCRHAAAPEDKDVAERFGGHGRAVLAALNHGLNRFLSFVRIEKGQYGVRPIKLDEGRLSSHAVGMEARAKIDDGDWFRWCPTDVMAIALRGPTENDPRFLRPADWPRVQEFVATAKKTHIDARITGRR